MASYTSLSRSDVEGILARYPIRVSDASPLPGGAANSSYLIRTESLPYVLTVLDNHDYATAGRLAALLEHLDANEIPTSRPLRTLDEVRLVSFGQRPVLVKEYVVGRCDGMLPVGRHLAAGELLARVHQVPAPGWLPLAGRRLPAGWAEQADRFRDDDFVAWLHDQWRRASAVEAFDGSYGLVHGDFFADNLVVRDDGQLAVLDWETATRDLLVLDVGMAIVGLCRAGGGSFLPELAVEFLRGYEARRPLSREERTLLPEAARYASLVIAYHRYLRHHVTHPDRSKQHLYHEIPRFVRGLDQRWTDIASGGNW